MTKWVVASVVFILILAAAAYLALMPGGTPPIPTGPEPTTFAECATEYQVNQSYPRTCTTHLGITFTEDIGNALDMQNTITVDAPKPNDTIQSPLTIRGSARGSYYFEGTFPVEVHSADGTVVGSGQAEALGAWTTTDFVKFNATITFTKPSFGMSGTLVFKNDNPSGDPNNQRELDVPIQF